MVKRNKVIITRMFFVSLLLTITMCFSKAAFMPQIVFADTLSGSGTENDPYEISNVLELRNIESLDAPGVYFKLMDDIDFETDMTAPPFMSSLFSVKSTGFQGVFDGDGHVFYGLNVTGAISATYLEVAPCGLFSRIEATGVVKNIGIIDPYVFNAGDVGVIAGLNKGEIKNSFVNISKTVDVGICGITAGGIAGRNMGNITNCYVAGDCLNSLLYYVPVSFDMNIGGITGDNAGSIENCFANVDIEVSKNAGGIACKNTGTILNSFAANRMFFGPLCRANSVVGKVVATGDGNLTNTYGRPIQISQEIIQGLSIVISTNGSLILESDLQDRDWYKTTLNWGNPCDWNLDDKVTNGYYPHVYKEGMTVELIGQWDLVLPYLPIPKSDPVNLGEIFENSSINISASQLVDDDRVDNLKITNVMYSGSGNVVNNPSSLKYTAQALLETDIVKDNFSVTVEDVDGNTVDVNITISVKSTSNFIDQQWVDDGGFSSFDKGKSYKLLEDIDVSGVTGFPLCSSFGESYNGIFDGRGHKITGLSLNVTTQYAGLFGYIGYSGVVKNLHLDDVSVVNNNQYNFVQYTGALAGYNAGEIINCSMTGSVDSGWLTGGMIGYNSGEIYNSWAAPKSVNGSCAGGLVANNENQGKIVNCYAINDENQGVSGSENAGGLVGENGIAEIVNCFSTGKVTTSTGDNHGVGGLVGTTNGFSSSKSIVKNSFSTCNVNNNTTASNPAIPGRVVGFIKSYSDISNCYGYDGQKLFVRTTDYSDTPRDSGSFTPFNLFDLNNNSWYVNSLGWTNETDWNIVNRVDSAFYPDLYEKDTNDILPYQIDTFLANFVQITGNAVFNETLTVDTSNLDGITGVLQYQWIREGEDIFGATNSAYTLVQQDIGKHIAVKITSSVETGTITSAKTATVQKLDCVTTIVTLPVLSGISCNSVTLTEVTGYEYTLVANDADVSTGIWQDSNEFIGLIASTDYDFYQRVKETATYKASIVSDKLDITTDDAPSLKGTVAIQGTLKYGETITAVLDNNNNTGNLLYQWTRDGNDINEATNSTYILVQADIGAVIAIKITSSAEAGTVTSDATAAVAKADASVPLTPIEENHTYNSVILTAVAGYEYAVDDGTWQTPNVFNGLTSSTTYSFKQRIAETVTRNASTTSSAISITTDLEPVNAVFIAVSKTDVITYGGNDGRITVTASGGSGNYEYSKDNGSIWQDDNKFEGLTAGVYNVMARDKGETSNISAVNTVHITQPPAQNFVDLLSLSIQPGTLNPSFEKDTFIYKAMTDTVITQTAITAELSDTSASLTINGKNAESGVAETVMLEQDGNLIPIVITSSDGNTQKTYYIAYNETSSNSDLKSLTVSEGTLNFDSDTTTYTVKIERNIDTLIITATPSDSKSIVMIDGRVCSSSDIEINDEETIIEIVVIAQNTTTKTYTVIIKKKSSSSNSDSSKDNAPKVIQEQNAVDKALENGKKNEEGKLVGTVKVEKPNSKGDYEQEISSDYFKEENKILKIETSVATVTLPDNMFTNTPKEGVKLSITEVSKDKLPKSIREQFGDKPVIDINMTIGGKKVEWSNNNVEVEITIPYKPTEEELNNPYKIIAVYIDDNGNIIPLTMSNYDSESGGVVFKTKHFSYYGVQYSDKNFEDLSNYTWAEEAIEALSARGIINGITDKKFAPQANISRADFVVLITRFFELEGKGNTNFSDVKAGTYYYKAVSTAKEMGIVSGTGDNQFNPTKSISRQDMMVIIKRALEITDKDNQVTAENNKKASDFNDGNQVASYAKDSVEYFITRGIISGDGENINPTGYTKRAEVAALLYKLLARL